MPTINGNLYETRPSSLRSKPASLLSTIFIVSPRFSQSSNCSSHSKCFSSRSWLSLQLPQSWYLEPDRSLRVTDKHAVACFHYFSHQRENPSKPDLLTVPLECVVRGSCSRDGLIKSYDFEMYVNLETKIEEPRDSMVLLGPKHLQSKSMAGNFSGCWTGRQPGPFWSNRSLPSTNPVSLKFLLQASMTGRNRCSLVSQP
jgi:hypothetical protein